MRIKTKTKDCRLIVKVKTAGNEPIEERELDRFSRVYMRGFLKPALVKKSLVEYTGPVGISLFDRLKKPITKREFLFIVEQVVVAVQKLHANNFPVVNMIMDLHNVYINEATKEVQFIYIPLALGQKNSNLISFIESIVYSVIPSDEKDNDYVSRFVYFFRSINPFDINKVETFVVKEDRSVVNIIRRQHAGQSGFMTNKQQNYYRHYEEKKTETTDESVRSRIEYDPTKPYGIDGAADGSGKIDDTDLLAENDGTGLLVDDYEESTDLLIDEEETALLDEDEKETQYPTLYRVLTEESISINKPVFRLGKEKSYVDYFVTNNTAVSRSHADIITRGNRCYVVDLNSKNHSYINDQIIPVRCEMEIHNGDKLKLGNEEFIFYM